MRLEEVRAALCKIANTFNELNLLIVITDILVEHHVLVVSLDSLNLVAVVNAITAVNAWLVQLVLGIKGLANLQLAIHIIVVGHLR